jgi:Na+(H+)/acetate symporter ActP
LAGCLRKYGKSTQATMIAVRLSTPGTARILALLRENDNAIRRV